MSDFSAGHPDQTALRDYSLDELAGAQAAALEEHLLICEVCRQTVSELDIFAPLMQRRSGRSSAAYLHETPDGAIALEIRALPGRKWRAHFSGEKLEGGAVFDSPAEAYAHLRSAFSGMYPDHLCTAACGGDL